MNEKKKQRLIEVYTVPTEKICALLKLAISLSIMHLLTKPRCVLPSPWPVEYIGHWDFVNCTIFKWFMMYFSWEVFKTYKIMIG